MMGSLYVLFCFFKQKTSYEIRIRDWSSDVCSSDLSIDTTNGRIVAMNNNAGINGGLSPTIVKTIGLILAMGINMSACSDNSSWKEEVLLHDGSKIVVERTVDRGGRHEIGQQPPIKEQSATFILHSTNERITWQSKFSAAVGLADFQQLITEIFQGAAYVVTK